jgi:hypothetical protein
MAMTAARTRLYTDRARTALKDWLAEVEPVSA